MASLYDMVKTLVLAAPGTGPISPGPALPGFLSFSNVTPGTTVSYGAGDSLVSGNYTVWEVGRSLYSGGVLGRGPLFSSNGGSAVNLGPSTNVWITLLAEDLLLSLGGNASGTTGNILLPDITLTGGVNIGLVGAANGVTINALSSYTYNQPVNGATITLTAGVTALLADPAAEIATLTVVVPPSPSDGQICGISTTQIIDALTVNPAAGASLLGGGPMILQANGGVGWRYRAANTTWYRTY